MVTVFWRGEEINLKKRGQAKKTNTCEPSVCWATIFGTRMSLHMLVKLEFTAVGKCVWHRGKIYGVMESVIVFFNWRRWSSGELKQTVGTNVGLFFWETKVKNVDKKNSKIGILNLYHCFISSNCQIICFIFIDVF